LKLKASRVVFFFFKKNNTHNDLRRIASISLKKKVQRGERNGTASGTDKLVGGSLRST